MDGLRFFLRFMYSRLLQESGFQIKLLLRAYPMLYCINNLIKVQ